MDNSIEQHAERLEALRRITARLNDLGNLPSPDCRAWCDDCGAYGDAWTLGIVQVCWSCYAMRRRAAVKLYREELNETPDGVRFNPGPECA